MEPITWILIGVAVVVAFAFYIYYNRFAVLSNRIDNSLSQIDVQLKRRADLIPNLVKTIKGFVKHEEKAIEAVTEARKALVGAKGLDKKLKADNQLESALKSIFAIAEGYPDLKANTNFLELQRELATTEDKVAYARQFYNDSFLSYENMRKTFPGNMFANLYGFGKKEYLKITSVERKKVDVSF